MILQLCVKKNKIKIDLNFYGSKLTREAKNLIFIAIIF
jgi:hypothetical protein